MSFLGAAVAAVAYCCAMALTALWLERRDTAEAMRVRGQGSRQAEAEGKGEEEAGREAWETVWVFCERFLP